MVVAVFRAARGAWALPGAERHAAGQFAGDLPDAGPGRDRARQRHTQKISQTLAFHRPHAICELFHDYDLSDSSALPALDVGPSPGDRVICHTHLAGVALWPDAGPQSLMIPMGERNDFLAAPRRPR